MPSAHDVLTLRDLETWSRTGTSLAVLGHPIKHSISPAMHNAALAAQIARRPDLAAWQYFRFDVPPNDLPAALTQLYASGFRGVNLTVPHKILAINQVASIDDAARPCGAVNTLLRTDSGWRGFNTDGYGLAAGIRETLGRELGGSQVVLLGAGGAARGAAIECVRSGCASLSIVNRSRDSLEALLAIVRPCAGATRVEGFTAQDVPAGIFREALVINATSAGLSEDDPLPVDLADVTRPAAVYDMIYNPPQTKWLRQATALGLPHANGLTMLVHQGAKALEIWSGVPAAELAPAMSAAARAALAR